MRTDFTLINAALSRNWSCLPCQVVLMTKLAARNVLHRLPAVSSRPAEGPEMRPGSRPRILHQVWRRWIQPCSDVSTRRLRLVSLVRRALTRWHCTTMHLYMDRPCQVSRILRRQPNLRVETDSIGFLMLSETIKDFVDDPWCYVAYQLDLAELNSYMTES